MNEDNPKGKRFTPLQTYGEHFINTRTWSNRVNHYHLSDTETFFNFLKQFFRTYCSKKCKKLLESFEKRYIKLLGRQAQNF